MVAFLNALLPICVTLNTSIDGPIIALRNVPLGISVIKPDKFKLPLIFESSNTVSPKDKSVALKIKSPVMVAFLNALLPIFVTLNNFKSPIKLAS